MDTLLQTQISRLTQAQRAELASKLRLLAGQKSNQQRQVQVAASQIAVLQLQARMQPPAFPTKASPVRTATASSPARHPSILGSQSKPITRMTRTSLSGSGVHPRATLQERRACGCWLCAK
jgi:hypothetical protein